MSEADQAKAIRRLLNCEQKRSSPFDVLSLDIATCSVDDVNKAFRKIALLLHPDKCSLPRCGDAFHVAETAHKMLSQEVVLSRLKAADARRREKEAETKTFVPQKPSTAVGAGETEDLPRPAFGSLTKLAASGMSSDEQKTAEIARVLACKPTEYFLILDVDPSTCEVADIDKRYRRMAQALHPDKCSLPRVTEAFTVFEKAHKELADEKKLIRFKLGYEQQRKKEAALRAEATRKANQDQRQSSSSSYHNLTPEERLELRKREALREHQLQSARLAEEAARKRQKHEQETTEKEELAADLERQRKEWRDLQMF